MARQKVVYARMQLVGNGTTDLWLDLMKFLEGVSVKRVFGRLVLCEKVGNFRARVGIQTADSDVLVPNAPVNPSSGTGVGYVSSVVKQFVDFDPRGGTEGDVDAKAYFRLGVLYSSSDATVSRGDVMVELWIED